ncbi:hypothetical protein HY492_03965 [Candidatus Woesearchaeota archaeon]|nr:hypothetical protein [Candidatus Woesearchaeota archaeon]
MKTTAILALCLLILAGCSPALQKLPEAPLTPVSSATPAPAPTPSPVSVDYSMTPETEKKLHDGLTSTTKYFVTESYAPLSSGQHYTFGIGFTNRFPEKDNFLVDVAFKRAYDKSTNTIDGVDASDVATWLSHNDYSVTPLQPNQQSFQTIVIEANNFADGRAPPKGTYEFDVNIFHQAQFPEVNQEYSGDLTLAIQVT